MATKIKLRRGTAAEWTSANPILEAGEAGVETDTRKIKIGNGSTAWNSLAYAAESLPTQTNNTGKVLSTNGTSASWVDPPSNRNLIINGAMQVSQRGTSSTGITASGYYTADRWNLVPSSLGTWTNTLETDAPTGSGFVKSFKILCTTADATPAAGDLLIVQHGGIEGQDLQRVKKGTASAEQLTLSFWVKSNVTGTYVANLFDNDNNRSVSISYAISASATWERKTITFPADTTGAFDNDNGNSLGVQFWLGAGSNFTSGTLNTTWGSATSANRAVGQTNLAAATNNYWQITGVQLETGPVATPFEFESYQNTLRKCQRYYYLYASGAEQSIGNGATIDFTQVVSVVHFPTEMRTAPTLFASTGTDYYQVYTDGARRFNSFSLQQATKTSGTLRNQSLSNNGTRGQGAWVTTWDAGASIAFGAEL